MPFSDELVQHGVYTALAEGLYTDGVISLGKAAKLARMSIPGFAAHLRDEAEIKVPGCAEILFVVFVTTSGA